ncbi:hypothetical protein WDU94_013168 [Cyamophila willieti]
MHCLLLCVLNMASVKIEHRIPLNMMSRFLGSGQTQKKIFVSLRFCKSSLSLFAIESLCYVYGKCSRDRKYLIPWVVQILYGFLAHQLKLLFVLLREDIRRSSPITALFTLTVGFLVVYLMVEEYRTLKGTLYARLRMSSLCPIAVDSNKLEHSFEIIQNEILEVDSKKSILNENPKG